MPTDFLQPLLLTNQVDHLTELLERSLDNPQRLLSASAATSGANGVVGNNVPRGPNAGSQSTLGGSTGHVMGGMLRSPVQQQVRPPRTARPRARRIPRDGSTESSPASARAVVSAAASVRYGRSGAGPALEKSQGERAALA